MEFISVRVANQKLVRRPYSRNRFVDIAETDDAETILGEVFDGRCGSTEVFRKALFSIIDNISIQLTFSAANSSLVISLVAPVCCE